MRGPLTTGPLKIPTRGLSSGAQDFAPTENARGLQGQRRPNISIIRTYVCIYLSMYIYIIQIHIYIYMYTYINIYI